MGPCNILEFLIQFVHRMCAHCVVTFFHKYVCGSNFFGERKKLRIPGQNSYGIYCDLLRSSFNVTKNTMAPATISDKKKAPSIFQTLWGFLGNLRLLFCVFLSLFCIFLLLCSQWPKGDWLIFKHIDVLVSVTNFLIKIAEKPQKP